jgi:hypothetical protein
LLALSLSLLHLEHVLLVQLLETGVGPLLGGRRWRLLLLLLLLLRCRIGSTLAFSRWWRGRWGRGRRGLMASVMVTICNYILIMHTV